MVFRGTSAVLPRFFRGAVGTALFVAVAFSVARAAVGPHGDSKCAPVPKIENRAHISSALASAVAPRHFGILGSCPLGGILQALGRTIVLLLSLYVFAFAVVTAVGLPRWSSAGLQRFFRGSSAAR